MKQLRNPRLLIGLLPIVIVGIGIVIALVHKPPTNNHTPGTSGKPATAVVEITSSGFMPQTIAVKPNTNVVWVNEDVMPHLPAADPYPTHANLPSLVAPRALGKKETYSYLFTKAGTVHYHDDLHPTLTGEVEVR
jgi:plastocyanin